MECLEKFLRNYRGLFDNGTDSEEESDGAEIDSKRKGGFIEYFRNVWGWHNSAEKIAIIERVTLNEVFDFSAVRFFNCVSYLKAKDLYESEINKQWSLKQKGAVNG